MKKLNHPNVIRMHDVVDDPEKDKLCIILDYHENGALMDTSPLPAEPVTALSMEDCKRFFADVLDGLTYLHYQNVVHFDLKPDNILVSRDRRGVIADFGVSRMLADATRSSDDDVLTSGSPGTPMYLAPEVWGDTQYRGKTADIWSLGVTLFVMAYGYAPFDVATHDELVDEVCKETPVTIPEDMDDADLVDLLSRLLEKDPRNRISLADIAQHPFVESAASRPSDLRRQYSRITVNAAEIRAAVTIAGHANSFARDQRGRIVKRTRASERDVYESITKLSPSLASFLPPYHGELDDVDALAAFGPDQRPSTAPRLNSFSQDSNRESGAEGGRDVCIVLDDVTADMQDACVMDIKMGLRTFSDVRREHLWPGAPARRPEP